jgi:hypothetical protein
MPVLLGSCGGVAFVVSAGTWCPVSEILIHGVSRKCGRLIFSSDAQAVLDISNYENGNRVLSRNFRNKLPADSSRLELLCFKNAYFMDNLATQFLISF